MNLIQIIGLGLGRNHLSTFHEELISKADILVGGSRQLSLFPEFKGRTIKIGADINGLVSTLLAEMKQFKIVVLASGDPLFYGIGTTLSKHIPNHLLQIRPNVSSISAAFSSLCLPWHDATLISLHHSHEAVFDFSSLAFKNKVAFLTSPERGPAFIAEQLTKNRLSGFKVCILENLGHPSLERINWYTDYHQITQQTFRQPNLVILQRQDIHEFPEDVSHETHLGMPDNEFTHAKGLITKSEIRSISLAKLKLSAPNLTLWDIGAGCGSVGIEAAFILKTGMVHAIEKNENRLCEIKENIKKFKLSNLVLHHGAFPETRPKAPPDRVFIGGGGKGIKDIVNQAALILKPGGRMVINTVVIENMASAIQAMSECDLCPEMIHVQVSQSTPIAEGHRLKPLNPVWIISGNRPI